MSVASTGKGDLAPFSEVAHRYTSGVDDEAIAYTAESFRKLRKELETQDPAAVRHVREQFVAILDQIAKDPERAAALAQMTSRQRIAEIARMTIKPAESALAAPAAPPPRQVS